MRVKGGRIAAFASTRVFHLIILGGGTLFLLLGAFHGNVWFDESYSVALANHSFADIWRIGSGDVHPVLFYWALHVLNLVFGQNIVVYRLFTVAGAVALAALGYTHVRHDFGRRAGVLFSFFALFTPYVVTMSIEIRMYSWATFAVMLCMLSAWRIFDARRSGRTVPLHSWIVFFAASLASAYLHYFGVLAAFTINALLLIYLLVSALRKRGDAAACAKAHEDASKASTSQDTRPPRAARASRSDARGSWRAVGVFLLGAIVQVLLYAPWLIVLIGQVGVVSQTYWANLVFPTSYIELATYPIMTSQISFAARGAYGPVPQSVLEVLGIAALAMAAVFVLRACLRIAARNRPWDRPSEKEDAVRAVAAASGAAEADDRQAAAATSVGSFRKWLSSDTVLPALCALGVYLGAAIIAFAASLIMGSNILYYRYLFVTIGPLLLAAALLLSRVKSRLLVGGVCAIVLGVSLVNEVLLVHDDYDPANRVPLEQLAEKAPEADAIISSDIGIEGVTAVTYPHLPQIYMDWQHGNWDVAYEAYAPTLTSKKSWEAILDDFHGRFIVLGQTQQPGQPRDVRDLQDKPGISLIDTQTFYRPYERTYFTIAVMNKD